MTDCTCKWGSVSRVCWCSTTSGDMPGLINDWLYLQMGQFVTFIECFHYSQGLINDWLYLQMSRFCRCSTTPVGMPYWFNKWMTVPEEGAVCHVFVDVSSTPEDMPYWFNKWITVPANGAVCHVFWVLPLLQAKPAETVPTVEEDRVDGKL